MKRVKLSLLCGVLLFAAYLRAQDEDAEGCKDSPIITRMPGSTLTACDNKEYEEAPLPLANGQEKKVEGEYHTWSYRTREGVSKIQVFRNIEAALKRAGFTFDYEDPPTTITAHKAAVWYWLDTNPGAGYDQTLITEKQMEQEITADAASLSDELKKTGHVAVYGIRFDTGKATIQPDSEAILQQIAKLLQGSPALKLQIEGHTDNQGNAAANQALSEKRAQAVLAWLTAHGINSSRLAARGLGAAKPVADNSTEDGRAKNRRVELVQQ